MGAGSWFSCKGSMMYWITRLPRRVNSLFAISACRPADKPRGRESSGERAKARGLRQRAPRNTRSSSSRSSPSLRRWSAPSQPDVRLLVAGCEHQQTALHGTPVASICPLPLLSMPETVSSRFRGIKERDYILQFRCLNSSFSLPCRRLSSPSSSIMCCSPRLTCLSS